MPEKRELAHVANVARVVQVAPMQYGLDEFDGRCSVVVGGSEFSTRTWAVTEGSGEVVVAVVNTDDATGAVDFEERIQLHEEVLPLLREAIDRALATRELDRKEFLERLEAAYGSPVAPGAAT